MTNSFTEMFTSNTLGSLNLIIFSFFIGACLAGFAFFYHKRVIGGLIRYLLKEEAFAPESAKTLRDAEQDLNIFVRIALHKNSAFRRIVNFVEPQLESMPSGNTADKSSSASKEGKSEKSSRKTKFSDIPMYIVPEQKVRAEEMYAEDTSSPWMILIYIVVFGIIAYLSTYIIPYLVDMVNNLIESL